VLAGWTFPIDDASSATADLGITGNVNVKTISRESGFSGTYTFSSNGYTPTNEYLSGILATKSISTANWDVTGAGWIISFITDGYEEIKFYSDIRSSNFGPKNYRIDYSFDGSVWTPTTNTVELSGTTMSTLNGDLPSACSNQSIVYLRWTVVGTTSANGSTITSDGTNRLDNIVIVGKALGSVIDTVAPVLTFDPLDNATNVSVSTAITITSNEPLKKADDTELTDGDLSSLIVLKETNASGTDVPFAAAIDITKKIITITPSADLANSQLYYVAISPVADTAQNLTALQSVTFTTRDPLSTEADILTYSLPNQISSNIDAANTTISVDMPAGSDITNQIATFTTSNGAAVTISGTPQISGTTANDFTNPVIYTVVSEDGNTTKLWTVNVTVILSAEADILTFTIPDQIGNTIIDADEAEISVTMPAETDVTSLVPAITISDYAIISPLSGVAQDFTNIFDYTVTAQNGTVKVWHVTVRLADPPPSNENLIISFTLPGQIGNTIIDNDSRTVTVQMPVGVSLVSLIPSIYISQGATISPSADAIRDFSNPVTYIVTSASGISAVWVVEVQQGSPDEGLLFSFISGTQIFHIENKTLGLGRVDIFANDGRLMYSEKRVGNVEFNIDMSGYAGGMYIIRIWDKNYALTKTIKIIK
ncbi:MAG: Ig-like domain-containing protein, partial [Prevotellaceae bacterium]|nr:Ig-like domain-containing protein [Prevotellaceae bacterium]